MKNELKPMGVSMRDEEPPESRILKRGRVVFFSIAQNIPSIYLEIFQKINNKQKSHSKGSG